MSFKPGSAGLFCALGRTWSKRGGPEQGVFLDGHVHVWLEVFLGPVKEWKVFQGGFLEQDASTLDSGK